MKLKSRVILTNGTTLDIFYTIKAVADGFIEFMLLDEDDDSINSTLVAISAIVYITTEVYENGSDTN